MKTFVIWFGDKTAIEVDSQNKLRPHRINTIRKSHSIIGDEVRVEDRYHAYVRNIPNSTTKKFSEIQKPMLRHIIIYNRKGQDLLLCVRGGGRRKSSRTRVPSLVIRPYIQEWSRRRTCIWSLQPVLDTQRKQRRSVHKLRHKRKRRGKNIPYRLKSTKLDEYLAISNGDITLRPYRRYPSLLHLRPLL